MRVSCLPIQNDITRNRDGVFQSRNIIVYGNGIVLRPVRGKRHPQTFTGDRVNDTHSLFTRSVRRYIVSISFVYLCARVAAVAGGIWCGIIPGSAENCIQDILAYRAFSFVSVPIRGEKLWNYLHDFTVP